MEGTDADLGFLSKLTGLRWLNLSAVPITDLEALRPLTKLQHLELHFDTELTDISALADLPELEELTINNCPVDSIDALRGKKGLRSLTLIRTGVTDIGPLADCDFSRMTADDWFDFSFDNINDEFGNVELRNAGVLASIPRFGSLNLANVDSSGWAHKLDRSEVRNLSAFRFASQEAFDYFVETHPTLESMNIPWNINVRDLSKLTELPNLKFVSISSNMEEAVKSLEGKKLGFELEIQQAE